MTRVRLAALWALLVVLAACVSALIPPMQSPDEHSHIVRAYVLARGQLLLETPPGESTGGPTDDALIWFMTPWLHKVVSGRAKRLEEPDRIAVRKLQWSHQEHFFPTPGTGYNFPLAYLPHAAGLALGKALDLSVLHSYRLVRVFCMGAIAALLIAAFRIQRPPLAAMALLLLPMTVFQMLLPTLDGVTTATAVLALSLSARRLFDPGEPARWEPWLLCGALFLVASTRVQLAPLLVLPFYLAWQRRSKAYVAAGAVALLGVLAWTAWALTHTVDTRVTRTQTTGQMVLHYTAHPLEYVRIVWTSITDRQLSSDYSRGFVGIVGWLDTHMAVHWYTVLWIALGLCFALSLWQARARQGAAGRGVLVFTAVASVLLAFFALLVAWTPHPARTVEGIQGRYFIVPALALAYATARPPGDARAPWWPYAVAAAFGTVALYALISTVLARYH